MRNFCYRDPETGLVIRAELTTQLEHNARAARKYPDGSYVNTFTYLCEVTQWGFDCRKTIVCCKCDQDGKTWAYRMVELYPAQQIDVLGF